MKRKNLLMKTISLALIAAMALTGCSTGGTEGSSGSGAADESTGSDSDMINIGVALPTTGTNAKDGESCYNGAKAAVEEINEAGGINGKKVNLVYEDDQSDASQAAAIANKFVENDDILAVISSYSSSPALAAVPIYDKAGLAMLCPSGTSPALSGVSKYFFRVCASDAYLGSSCGTWSGDLGWKKVAVLYESDDWGEGLKTEYEKAAEAAGIEIVMEEKYTAGQTTDFNSILTKVKNADVDGVFLGSLYNEAALIVKQAKTLGVDVPFMGTDGLYSPAYIELAGANADGSLLLGAFYPESEDENVKSFIESYQKALGTDEVPGTYEAFGYDCAMVIMEAMKTCETLDRESIRNAIAATKDYVGASGTCSFDENGDCAKEYIHMTVKDEKFVIAD